RATGHVGLLSVFAASGRRAAARPVIETCGRRATREAGDRLADFDARFHPTGARGKSDDDYPAFPANDPGRTPARWTRRAASKARSPRSVETAPSFEMADFLLQIAGGQG